MASWLVAEPIALVLALLVVGALAIWRSLAHWAQVAVLVIGGCLLLALIGLVVAFRAAVENSEYGAGNTTARCAGCGGPIIVRARDHGGRRTCSTCGVENRISDDGVPVPKPDARNRSRELE